MSLWKPADLGFAVRGKLADIGRGARLFLQLARHGGAALRRFGLDATARQAVVAYDATLSRAGQSGTETRRFEAQVPVAAIDAESAGPALNQAANQVATQIADWVGR